MKTLALFILKIVKSNTNYLIETKIHTILCWDIPWEIRCFGRSQQNLGQILSLKKEIFSWNQKCCKYIIAYILCLDYRVVLLCISQHMYYVLPACWVCMPFNVRVWTWQMDNLWHFIYLSFRNYEFQYSLHCPATK